MAATDRIAIVAKRKTNGSLGFPFFPNCCFATSQPLFGCNLSSPVPGPNQLTITYKTIVLPNLHIGHSGSKALDFHIHNETSWLRRTRPIPGISEGGKGIAHTHTRGLGQSVLLGCEDQRKASFSSKSTRALENAATAKQLTRNPEAAVHNASSRPYRCQLAVCTRKCGT